MNNTSKSYPLVVIGAGAGGLVVAIGAAKAGKKVLLIEKGSYGGDCTNFGCIPSKSLIASANSAEALKEETKFGIDATSQILQTNKALNRVRALITEVRTHEEPLALGKIGVETLTGIAAFEGPQRIRVNDELIEAKQIVIATGASPFVPPIKGLSQTPFLTNETVFDLKEIPKKLAVLGGGPIGCELSQAFLRLGSAVTLIHYHPKLLNKEDPLAQDLIAKQFESEGMSLHLGANVTEVTHQNGLFQLKLDTGKTIEADALLVSVGRRPNVASLNLEAAGVNYTPKGITVDGYGRTNKSHIWALGDVIGSPFFTHWAENQARSILTSLLLPFPFKKKIDHKQAIPRVTFTDPEVASIGLSEKEARSQYNIATYIVPFSQVDRALTASRTDGFLQIITKKWSSRILGCTIVGERAGEMLGEVSLAMYAGIPLRKLSSLIHPYPTYNLAIRRAADMWLTQTILPLFKRKR